MTLRIGIAGYGYWGPNLARIAVNVPGAELAAIIDSDEKRLSNALTLYPKATGYGDFESALSMGSLDAVIIALPADQHADATRVALEKGIHVLVEKPMAMLPADAKRLTTLAEEKKLVLMPGHTFIYNDAVRWAKNYIDSGQLGDLLCIYSQRLNLGQLRKDVNVVWSLAPHDISVFDFLTGTRATSVSATAQSVTQPGIEDVAFISCSYPGNVIAHCHVSWLDPSKTRKITIIGTKGMLIVDDTSVDARIQIHEKYAEKIPSSAPTFAEFQFALRTGDVRIPAISFGEPLKAEVTDFVESIIGAKTPRASASDGVAVSLALSAAEESIKQGGAPVRLGF